MIEINLLPGAGRKSRRSGVPSGLSTAFSGIAGQIKDPYMIAAVASAVIAVSSVGALWLRQTSTEATLHEKEALAVQDSAKYATVILEKRKAETRRDSVLRQVRLIQAIDNDRFIWPHILAEVSKAVPQYTWLRDVSSTSPAVSPAAPVPTDSAALRAATTRADSIAILTPRSDPSLARVPQKFTVVGFTVDVQAMTRLIRDMEASPFIQNVQLVESKSAAQTGQIGPPVTEFRLQAEYQEPDSLFVKRAPIAVSVR
jgi:Tfp pilus assembly protein PilN